MERVDADAFVALTGQKDEFGEVAERINQRQNLGGQTTTGLTDRLSRSPLLRRCRAYARARSCRLSKRIRSQVARP